MKKRKIFLKAAELIEIGETAGCCMAIAHSTGDIFAHFFISKPEKFFDEYFRPPYADGFWMGMSKGGGGYEHRILALCLAQVLWDEENN